MSRRLKILVVERKAYDWVAWFENDPQRRVAHSSRIEAIGKLIERHSEYAGILLCIADADEQGVMEEACNPATKEVTE